MSKMNTPKLDPKKFVGRWRFDGETLWISRIDTLLQAEAWAALPKATLAGGEVVIGDGLLIRIGSES